MDKLHALATGNDQAVEQATTSLHAELRAARWQDVTEAFAAFPRAVFEHHRMTISLPSGRCVVLALNYRLGICLVEFAGKEDRVLKANVAKSRNKA